MTFGLEHVMISKYVAVVGVGRVGSCYAALLAQHHRVVMFDKNERLVKLLAMRSCPFDEPHLRHYLEAAPSMNLSAGDVNMERHSYDWCVIVVNTPSLPNGSFDASAVREVRARFVNAKRFIIVSTVSPGTIDDEEARTAYCPSLIALGNVINDLQYPETRIIGTCGDIMRKEVIEFLNCLMVGGTEQYVPDLTVEEAEWVKIAINGFITTKISFANMLAAATRGKCNVDPARVLRAVGSDPRIGNAYFKSGGTFGGPCFPRDTRALAVAAPLLVDYMEANDTANSVVVDLTVKAVAKYYKDGDKIGVLGFAYKPGVTYHMESYGSKVLAALRAEYGPNAVLAWDPKCGGSEEAKLAEVTVAGLPGLDIKCTIDFWS